ncbi:phage integrase [Marinobacter arenosus]|uniref:phage integrase n=1 Tax=Marinobacter arenosus TaxID=2856822 RepID=UPI001C4AF87A|nr:tyrosine-type recombinase/integrase [Marinobacter arenosus]MBW0147498.1 tyrosine-type recombinase/integrase [Marinobacter arenosus]
MIRKLPSGRWQVDLRTDGRGSKRIRKSFDSKAEAKRFETFVLAKRAEGREWNPSKSDNRTLKQLIKVWFNAKGVHLKDGERRKRCLEAMAELMGNPIARTVTPSSFLAYRAHKIQEGASKKTLNNHLGYLNAVYNQLNRLNEIDFDNPIRNVEMIRLDERELSWLTVEQIRHLLKTIEEVSKNPHVHLLTRICLATGARWGEAENLELRHVQEGKLTFVNTKSGKSRAVPLPPDLYQELREHLKEHGQFSFSLSAFRRALDKSGISLPPGQAAHVLRHTFASHFLMNGGDILALQRILGHSTISMTMRYSHLAPSYLIESLQYLPKF